MRRRSYSSGDAILVECRLVSFKTECSKPVRDVHRRSLVGDAGRAWLRQPRPVQVWGKLITRTGLSSDIIAIGRRVGHTRAHGAFRRGGALARLSLFSSFASLISPHGRIQMLRFALSAVALVGVLAMAQPVFADPLAATGSDHAQAAAATIEQPGIAGACMVVVIGWAGDECRTRQEHRSRWVWLGLGHAVPLLCIGRRLRADEIRSPTRAAPRRFCAEARPSSEEMWLAELAVCRRPRCS